MSVVLPVPASPMQHRDAAAARDAVLEVAQRLPVRVGQHQKARIRRQVERPLAQTEEALDTSANPRRAAAASATPTTAATASTHDTPTRTRPDSSRRRFAALPFGWS